MKRPFIAISLFCLVLFGGILAGYWDILNAEKLRIVRDRAGLAVDKMTDAVRGNAQRASDEAAAPAIADAPQPAVKARAEVPARKAEPAGDVPAPAAGAAKAAAEAERAAAARVQAEAPPAPAPASAASPPGSGTASPVSVPVSPPTFDILRVEPDGSAVLAGKAPAGARVSLIDGERRIGGETANVAGEFVVVLEDRLPEGDHQLRLEATMPDGRALPSAEAAIVSVPEEGREGELLAMVEAPGRPSRLLSLPEPAASDTPPAAIEAPRAEAEASSEVAPSSPPPPAAAAALSTEVAPSTGKGPSATASAAAVSLPDGGGAVVASAEMYPAPAAVVAPVAPAQAAPADPSALAVEAVEIEEDTIYVAGRTANGASVNVYVDNRFLSSDAAPEGGRFIVSSKVPLTSGNHVVRADALGRDGSVVARVEVPFFRPEGRTMAAIAPSSVPPAFDTPLGRVSRDADAQAKLESGGDDGAMLPAVTLPQAATIIAAAPAGAAAAEPPGRPVSPLEPMAAGESGTIARNVDGGGVEAGVVSSNAGAPGGTSSVGGKAARAAPDVSSAVPGISPSAAEGGLDAGQAAAAGGGERSLLDPGRSDVLSAGAVPVSEAGAIPVTRQPPLQSAPARVIIRRGDTLWRISRETYGQGRRYTVIYLANGDQIRNPNRIYPGQVFRMPADAASRR